MEEKESPTEEAQKGSFTVSDLTNKKDQEDFNFVNQRILDLQKVRKDHYGIDLDALWSNADRDYIPHRLGKTGKKVLATDEDKGWRGTKVTLGSNDWQSDVSQANPYVKIQTALSILVDQNPTGVFTPTQKRFKKTTILIYQLYRRSWEYAKSKSQLRLFVFNLAKYGWACARTYPLRIERLSKVLTAYDPENPSANKYEEKKVVEYNDIFRENLDPRNVWMDDMARPNNSMSINDWCWRKVYDMEEAKLEFGKYKLWDKVQVGGNTQEVIDTSSKGIDARKENKNLVEILFYENKRKDLFMVIANGVPVIIEPLPVSDNKGIKKLSVWQTYWNLRHAQSPYGIGIYEAIRYDQSILDRIRNMTIDQLTLAIYKMFFYQGTQSLTETGEIKIQPGVGKQVLDPKNVTWLEVPGPGRDAFIGIEMFRKDVDEASGITDPLLGQITGKTAFEIAQAKESALKRLSNPLDNILDALNDEGYITVSLIQLLYSVAETYQLSDPRLVEDYLNEIQSDPDLYERNVEEDPETGEPIESFTAKVYKEFPLNLDEDEKGNLIETKDTQFFRVKPSALDWEGVIAIKSQSLLSPSKQVDKALELEMYNLLTPLLATINAERQMLLMSGGDTSLDNLTNGKTAKAIIELYDKDPRDILPDSWLVEQEQPLFIPAQQLQQPQPGKDGGGGKPERLVGSTQLPAEPQGLVGKIMSRISAPFRRA